MRAIFSKAEENQLTSTTGMSAKFSATSINANVSWPIISYSASTTGRFYVNESRLFSNLKEMMSYHFHFEILKIGQMEIFERTKKFSARNSVKESSKFFLPNQFSYTSG